MPKKAALPGTRKRETTRETPFLASCPLREKQPNLATAWGARRNARSPRVHTPLRHDSPRMQKGRKGEQQVALPASEVDGLLDAAAASDCCMSGKKVLKSSSMMLGEGCWCAGGGTCSCTVGESSRLWMTDWRRRSRRTRPPGRGSSPDEDEAGDEEVSRAAAGPLLAPGPLFPPPTIRRRPGWTTTHGHGTVRRAVAGHSAARWRASFAGKRQCETRNWPPVIAAAKGL